ncbi:hypothetical protein GS429_10160 [Natronorubrum sp. JWXQ-INN-674]|uniref:Uncharacterized protein n=1 Tax=Natronorubrum halalkaliphilum TaxID=2691917 RepID=A0A6B0VLH8_9EURY|nr:hypothetical protein [Natronorubrum halalkaliphilum]MXV62420.1 hypothetical protein [Natronorubrum halalkaliphilum]
MRALSIELEDELVDVLETERELFGFESRQAYVRWIVEHRGSIEAEQGKGQERDQEQTRDTARAGERSAALPTGSNRDGTESGRHGDCTGDDSDTPAADSRATDESVLEVHGSPRTVRQGPDSKIRPDDETTDATAASESSETATDSQSTCLVLPPNDDSLRRSHGYLPSD